METVKLRKPLADGKTELKLDFDKITGYVLLKCEKEAKKDDPRITVPSISQAYNARVAAVAAGVKYDDILSMPAKDFSTTINLVQNFLLDSEDASTSE